MAEKAEAKSEAVTAPPAVKPAKAAGRGGLLGNTPVLIGGVMLLEAVVLFAGFKFLGGGAPQHVMGADLVAVETSGGATSDGAGDGKAPLDAKKKVEIPILDFRAPNKLSGRTFLYDVSIYAIAKAEFEERVKETLKSNEALIRDRVRTIIAQSDPEKLGGGSEPGLETLRRQVKYQLDEIIGEGLIDEVLVPRCTPFRTDY
jgi:flagellar basal body-associated protein FliL